VQNPEQRRLTPQPAGEWGILGGTFDPVHRGHLNLAAQIQKARALTGILFVPAYQPPHKGSRCYASFDDRLAMLELAIEKEPSWTISRIEAEERLSGRSLHTVRALKRRHPAAHFHLIVGLDNVGQLATWYHPDQLLEEIEILAGTRPDAKPSSEPLFRSSRLQIVDIPPFKCSSSHVRELIRKRVSAAKLAALVGDLVATYILKNKLYS